MIRELKISRRDGKVDSFLIEAPDHATVLDGLELVRSSHDSSLLYRHSCHHGSCGTCGVKVDGMPLLACIAKLSERETQVVIEPLSRQHDDAGEAVDLVADPERFIRDFPIDAPYLKTSRPAGDAPPEIERFMRLENCIECGLCVASCPVTERFLGPAILAAYHRMIEDDPEKRQSVLERVGGEDGIWRCERALNCSAVCPVGVNPARRIMELRRLDNTPDAP